jgi:anti-anti-sigma factor
MNGDTPDLHVEQNGSVMLARLSGDIDLSNAQALERRLLAATRSATAVVVDVSAVDYMDSSGVRLVERLARATATSGASMLLVVPESSFAADALGIVGLLDVMRVHQTVAEALAAADGAA